jgi:phosphatidylinositol kinase/protein kinase (PI-3  family)
MTADLNEPTMDWFCEDIPVIGPDEHPRKLFILESDDRQHPVLMKTHKDIRLHERAMQFFQVLKGVIRTNTVGP